MSDPFSAAVEAAVARAISAHIPTIIEAVRQAAITPTPAPDRFISIREAAAVLGMSSSSAWRLERLGKLPPREKIGGRCGYRQSTLDAILKGIGTGPLPAPPNPIKSGEKRGGRRGAKLPVVAFDKGPRP